jgi:prostaglandin-E synthase
LWAQRKDVLYITIEVVEAQNESLSVTEKSLSFTATEGSSNTKYAVEFEFYDAVEPSSVQQQKTDRHVSLVVTKADTEKAYWPRLVKAGKPHFVHTDFSKWKDEDEEDEDMPGMDGMGGMPGMGGMGDIDFSQFASMAGRGGFPDMGEGSDDSNDEEQKDEEDPYQKTSKVALEEDDE